MSVDPYTYCPCGSGKKMKFCCSKDLTHELDKIYRALEGDQRAAALDLVHRLIEDKGIRPALLAIQAEIQLSLENADEARQSAAELIKLVPHSPVALALQSLMDAMDGDLDAGVEHLQEALENSDLGIFPVLQTSLLVLCEELLSQRRFVSARGHLGIFLGMGGDPKLVSQAILSIHQDTQIPLLVKQDWPYAPAPSGARWQGEFAAAMKSASRGAWLAACESLQSLNEKVADQPAVWRNIAIMRSYLGQNEAAVQAWRKYASLPGVPANDAIEAEALAGLLVPVGEDDLVDVVRCDFSVPDIDRLMEKLLSDRQCLATQGDLAAVVPEGEPPPRGGFYIFDKPMITAADVHSISDLPQVLAQVYVFGRQTDRPARAEVILHRVKSFEERKAIVLQCLGDLVGSQDKEEVIGQEGRLRQELQMTSHFPRDIDAAKVKQCLAEHRRETYLNKWPLLPLPALNGKSVRETAADPALRYRAAAAILNAELADEEQAGLGTVDFNALRRELGLPERTTVQAHGQELKELSLVQLGRLDYSQLSDEELLGLYPRLQMSGYRTALRQCASEMVKRPSLEKAIDRGQVFETLVQTAGDPDRALEAIEQGRQAAVAKGQSPARWHLHELQVRLAKFEGEEATRLIRQINARHMQEPGVAQALYEILVRYGILNPDGSPAHVRADEAAAAPPAQASASASLWTPDSGAPAQKSESKLWLPGSD